MSETTTSVLQAPSDGPEAASPPLAAEEVHRLAGILARLPDAVARQMFEALPDAVVLVGSDWRFRFANQHALELVGRTDIIGHDIFELFPGNTQEPFSSTYRKTMETRVAAEFEAFNGPPLNTWFRVQVKPYEDGILIFFSDVSERKNAEIREQETARRLAEVLELTSDGVFAVDREWRYTFLNRSAKELIGRDDALLGKNLWEEFPWAVNGPSWEIYHRAMDAGVASHGDVKFPNPSQRWLSIQAQPAPEGIVVFFRDVTEERNHDLIVGRQQQLLTNVQSVARTATFSFDMSSGVITWGPGAYGIYGRPVDAVTNLTQLRELLVEGHEQILFAEMERCQKSGTLMRVEYAVYAPDGSILWIEARGEVYAEADETLTVRGVAIDVTQRHLDQQELIASEARYRVLADLNPQAIWMGDAAGKITYANQGFLAYLGLSSADLRVAGWLKAVAAEDRDRVHSSWQRSVMHAVDFDVEAFLRCAASGENRYWHLRAAAVRDASGTILHWLGVGQDVHDTKTYTAALRAEQMETERRRAELETLYTTTPVGLALIEPVNFTFLNLNDHEAAMLGAPRLELIGRPLAEIAPPEKIPEVFELLRQAARGMPVRNHLLEGELMPRPGERRAWSVNYTPIYNEEGDIRAISTASIEITHQKKAEAALIQSEKLAAVGRLASSISHEINNPLEAITNLLYLVSLDEDLPEQVKSYIRTAQSELSRVSQIATQTLRFHRQAVAPTYVSASELVDAVIRLYTGRLANSNIEVTTRYLTQSRIFCFENDVRQVLNNLIANAIDAMRSGGRLAIRAHRAQLASNGEPRPGIRITIADTGHGMSQATLQRIFEPFFTTKDLNGTGLGLWISAGIIERHQGRIRVRSRVAPGRSGTVFTLFLPCKEEPQPHE